MSIKEEVIQRLGTLSEEELGQVAEFVAFLKFRARLQPMPAPDEVHLATLYKTFAEEDRALTEEGLEEYMHGLCQEDAS